MIKIFKSITRSICTQTYNKNLSFNDRNDKFVSKIKNQKPKAKMK